MMTRPAQGHLAMLAFSALVAGSFSLGSLVANEIAPAALNTMRFFIAGAALGAVVFATGGIPRKALRAPWRYLVLGGLFAFYFVMMFEGLKTANPVSTSAVFTLNPLMSAMFGWLILRQVTTPRMALALAIGAAGALWVVFRADLDRLLAFEVGQGELIFFVGSIAHALYTPMVRLLNRGESAFVFSFCTVAAGFLMVSIWGWRDILATDWLALPWLVWFTILYVAIAASALTFLLLQFAALRLPSAKVLAYTYLTPSWVLLWELGLGHGIPPALVICGVGLTIMALVLLLKDEERVPLRV